MACLPLWEDRLGRTLKIVDKDDDPLHQPNICLPRVSPAEDPFYGLETFDGPGPWDRSTLEVEAGNLTGTPGAKKMITFYGNDYLNLSTHPAVRKAAAKAALVHGMGPRAPFMTCGHTDYHRLLEDTLAEMTKKDACVITPTGFAARIALLSALGNVASLTSAGRRPTREERIGIFADILNYPTIIDGLRLVEEQREADVFVYRHNDIDHLDELLSGCPAEKKVVYSESLFGINGDFAPILKLVELRKKHGYLFVVDEAHTILTCGRNGGGIGEVYGIQDQIDICIGTLSKATGCRVGFIACSEGWKKLIQARGQPFTFATSTPVPIIAACYAAVEVAKKESWRRGAVWSRVECSAMSPLVSLLVGSEQEAVNASRHMLECGFHVTAIRPPVVAPNACRLQLTLTSAHTSEDISRLLQVEWRPAALWGTSNDQMVCLPQCPEYTTSRPHPPSISI
ncbi:unnamed protein product [Spirodela intermedia]|uniref:serine C-palmitoyltransferase n=1 Tax=Spirodela intermedia TaxID=51605 RepID=A0A7I8KW19_SPIIN|nr:unnamed protein product [Spirodela intermedia]